MTAELERIAVRHIDERGDGVGELDARTVTIRGAFGGEVVEARRIHRSRQHPRDVAALVKVVRGDRGRRAVPCVRHTDAPDGSCDGCPLMALSIDAQRAQKRTRLAALGLDVSQVRGGAELGYRWSTKRVVFARAGQLTLGSWRRGTHRGATMRGCLVDHPVLRELTDEFEDAARGADVPVYDEASRRAGLRYIWLKTDGERSLVTLIGGGDDPDAQPAWLEALLGSWPGSGHAERVSVAWVVQPSGGNALLGGDVDARACFLRGGPIDAEIAGAPVRLSAGGFLQPNPSVIADAYTHLLEDGGGAPLRGGRAMDVYAGAGVTTARLRERFTEVGVSERHPGAARALGVEPSRAEAFLGAAAEASGSEPVELVVLNPPRKGLGAAVTAALIALSPARVHVMSCGPEGLKRDLAALTAGGFRLESLEAFDTLPQTAHVELVAKLVR